MNTEVRGGAVSDGGHLFSILIVNGVPVVGVFCPGEDASYALASLAALSLSGDDNSWPGIETLEIVSFALDAKALSSPTFSLIFPDPSVPANAASGCSLPKEKFKSFSESVKATVNATADGLLRAMKEGKNPDLGDTQIPDMTSLFIQKKGNA